MNSIPLFDITLLLLLFLGAWEFYILRAGNGINHIEKPVFTSLYFLFWSVTLATFFKERFLNLISKLNEVHIIWVFVFLIINWFIYKIANHYLTKPKKFIKEYPDEDFILLKEKYIIPKSFDILFQQTMIGLLVVMLYEGGLSLAFIIVIFAVIFGFLHTPLLRLKKTFGWFYVTFASLSAIIFPTVIIIFDSGLIYTYITHWSFYTISAMFFWFRENGIIDPKKIKSWI